MIDLGVKDSGGMEVPSIGRDKKPKEVIRYPNFTTEKPIGDFKYNDEFTATVRLRVKNVEHGEAYTGSKARHRTEIEVMGIEPVQPDNKPKNRGKGLPA